MATKTIGITEAVYERLRARKREGESFTDLVDRLLEETSPDWRAGFGTLPDSEADELRDLVEADRRRTGSGLDARQRESVSTSATSGDRGDEFEGGASIDSNDGASDDPADGSNEDASDASVGSSDEELKRDRDARTDRE